MTLDEAKQKIAKLAALRDNHAATAGEAANCAARIAEIMEKYQIDEASLRFHSEQDEDPDAAWFDETTNKDSGWKFSIAFQVGKNCSCYIFTSENKIKAVGRFQDRDSAKYMFDLICSQVVKISKEALEEEWDITGTGESRRWIHAFRLGCAEAINERLIEIRKNRDATNCIALMVLDKRLVRATQTAHQMFTLGNRSCGRANDSNAFGAGYSAGQSVNLGGRARAALPGR